MTFDHRAVTLAVFGLLALSSDSTIGGNSNVLVSAASWPWGGPLPTHSPVVPPPTDFCYTDNGAEVCIYFNDDLTCDVTLYGMSFRTGLAASFCASLAAEHQPDEFESLRANEHLSSQPSLVPSFRPTVHSLQPSEHPSSPSSRPSFVPSLSTGHTVQPSDVSSKEPSSSQPSEYPSSRPSFVPSSSSGPTVQPSDVSSEVPSSEPSSQPSESPSSRPSSVPSSSSGPTVQPSEAPSSKAEAQKAAEMAAAVAKEAEEALKAALKEAEKAAKEAQKEAEKAQKEAEKAQQEAEKAAAVNKEDMVLEEEESVFLSLMYTSGGDDNDGAATVGGTERALLFQSLGLRQRRGRRRAHAVRRRETATKNRRETMVK